MSSSGSGSTLSFFRRHDIFLGGIWGFWLGEEDCVERGASLMDSWPSLVFFLAKKRFIAAGDRIQGAVMDALATVLAEFVIQTVTVGLEEQGDGMCCVLA